MSGLCAFVTGVLRNPVSTISSKAFGYATICFREGHTRKAKKNLIHSIRCATTTAAHTHHHRTHPAPHNMTRTHNRTRKVSAVRHPDRRARADRRLLRWERVLLRTRAARRTRVQRRGWWRWRRRGRGRRGPARRVQADRQGHPRPVRPAAPAQGQATTQASPPKRKERSSRP